MTLFYVQYRYVLSTIKLTKINLHSTPATLLRKSNVNAKMS